MARRGDAANISRGSKIAITGRWSAGSAKVGPNPSRHGWDGWLHTEKAIPEAALGDFALVQVLLNSAAAAFDDIGQPIGSLIGLAESKADPNDWRLVAGNAVGVRYTPLTTRDHHRMGARERVLETAQRYPDRLHLELDALVTRIILDGSNRATGVEYLKGARLYRAHGQKATAAGRADAGRRPTREVILCGGAFNTPQLLMLSGIGPREVLEPLGIPVRIELPGVGRNLQDRYEIGVVNRMNFDRWKILDGATFGRGDPQYRDWAAGHDGVYASNGAVLAAILRSTARAAIARSVLLCAAWGCSAAIFPATPSLEVTKPNYLTWAILKAHTQNRAGEVRLRSTDPRDTPLIDFHYFEEGSDAAGEDLDSVVAGIRFVRRLTAKLTAEGAIAAEEQPGAALQSDDELKDFVRSHAWGHHASCTCAIGPRAAGGVLGSDFRVHGAQGLRVVDASVFPRIPGFFIASAVYMVAEKAADAILAG